MKTRLVKIFQKSSLSNKSVQRDYLKVLPLNINLFSNFTLNTPYTTLSNLYSLININIFIPFSQTIFLTLTPGLNNFRTLTPPLSLTFTLKSNTTFSTIYNLYFLHKYYSFHYIIFTSYTNTTPSTI